jgi:hypothetical protein
MTPAHLTRYPEMGFLRALDPSLISLVPAAKRDVANVRNPTGIRVRIQVEFETCPVGVAT